MTDNDAALNESTNDKMNGRTPVISLRTRVVGVAMLVILLISMGLDYLSQQGKLGGASDVPLVFLMLMPLAMAALILPFAVSFARGAIRTQWTLFGLGMLSVGVGNVIFVVLYWVTGKDPYPSVADVFTLTGYALFATAMYLAVHAYRKLLDIKKPLLIAAVVAIVAMAFVWIAVIDPYVISAPEGSQSLATRVLNTLYPVLDVFVLFMPAVTLGLLLGRLGAGRVAWPWWFVVSSATILALTDTIFAYATYVGARRTPIIDSGYALASMLLGLAVLVAWDVYHS